jgi:biopolymer transport protein ExbB
MSFTKLIAVIFAVLLIFGLFAGVVSAQDDEETSTQITLGDNLKATGLVGIFIGLLSIAMIAFIIEHFINVQRGKIIPPEIIQELEVFFEEEDYEGALQFCEANPGFVTNILAAALPRMSQGFEAMKETAMEIGEEEAVNLQIKISFLSLSAGLGPMLGLFGTVWGMIKAFNKLASMKGAANAASLATGISLALMTTLLGLLIAMPSLLFYFFFKNRVTRIILEAGVVVSEFVDRFRPVEE